MAYVDGFVIPVPKKKLDAYKKLARRASKIWREHGALEYRERLADDMDVHCGPGFTKQMKLKRDETVVFAWIVYKSRAHRDRVNEKVLADPRIASMDPKTFPFDPDRMVYGGFEMFVDA